MIRAAFPIPCFALETKSLKCFKACDFHNIMAKKNPHFLQCRAKPFPMLYTTSTSPQLRVGIVY